MDDGGSRPTLWRYFMSQDTVVIFKMVGLSQLKKKKEKKKEGSEVQNPK